MIAAVFSLTICLLFFGPLFLKSCQRRLQGVKTGVTLEGQPVERLLESELYDVVAGLAEAFNIEASNASWDWQNSTVRSEIVGQVVDVQATVDLLLQAEPQSPVHLVTVAILPSVTSAYFQPYYRGPTAEPRVSLMINVDWGNEFIPDLLEVFQDYDVSTTWFLTGRWAALYPGLAKEIALAGHEIGNHGAWHGLAGQMSRAEVTRLILEGEDQLLAATGQKSQLFAPPAGDLNKEVVAIAAELGYKTVLWTLDTVDWQRPAPTVIVDRVIGKIKNGSLVLMHPTKPTLEALPVILDHLLDLGFQCLTVGELLAD